MMDSPVPSRNGKPFRSPLECLAYLIDGLDF